MPWDQFNEEEKIVSFTQTVYCHVDIFFLNCPSPHKKEIFLSFDSALKHSMKHKKTAFCIVLFRKRICFDCSKGSNKLNLFGSYPFFFFITINYDRIFSLNLPKADSV